MFNRYKIIKPDIVLLGREGINYYRKEKVAINRDFFLSVNQVVRMLFPA
jgi:hypothetical protein